MTITQSLHARRRTLSRNILKTFARATPEDMNAGLRWYPRACSGVEAWADSLDIPRATVACVIAALSPQCEWTVNLRSALQVLTGEPVSWGLQANVNKATRIYSERLTSLDGVFVDGPKVKAFSLNLQGCADIVTIDTHAAQLALDDVTSRVAPSRHYNVFAEAYRTAAHTAGIRPCDIQAVTWHVWKREHPPAQKRIHRAQWSVVGEL